MEQYDFKIDSRTDWKMYAVAGVGAMGQWLSWLLLLTALQGVCTQDYFVEKTGERRTGVNGPTTNILKYSEGKTNKYANANMNYCIYSREKVLHTVINNITVQLQRGATEKIMSLNSDDANVKKLKRAKLLKLSGRDRRHILSSLSVTTSQHSKVQRFLECVITLTLQLALNTFLVWQLSCDRKSCMLVMNWWNLKRKSRGKSKLMNNKKFKVLNVYILT